MSRKVNSIRNFQTSVISEIISIVLNFITRSIFISILGTEYLGASSLTVNILSMLSLTELGFGSAMTFHLYKPISANDIPKLKSILYFFNKIYRYIGVTISILGLVLVPFIPYLIKDNNKNINIQLVFIFYLFQTVSSYLFYGYKHSLLRAHQKEHLINVVKSYFSIIISILQILVLIIMKSFYLYVLLTVLSNVAMNLIIASKADKLFVYLKDKDIIEIDNESKSTIFKDAYAIFFYKIYDKVISSSSTIVISKFLGFTILGIYSNYLLILNTLQTFLSKFYTSILASLSDLYSRGNKDYTYSLFKTINFLTVYTFSFVAITVSVTINLFIELWLGERYLLTNEFVLLFSFSILLNGYRVFFDTFRTSMGLFQASKYRPILGAIINILFSLILVGNFGLNGIILATIIANCLTYMWYDPYIILKLGFSKKILPFLIDNLYYLISTLISLIITNYIISSLPLIGVGAFVVNINVSFLVVTFVFSTFFYRSDEFTFLFSNIMNIMKSLIKK